MMRWVLVLLLHIGFVACAEWAVEVSSNLHPDEIARQHNCENLGPIGYLKNHYLFSCGEGSRRDEESVPIHESEHLAWAEQQQERIHMKRGMQKPADPMYSAQWHLHNTRHPEVDVQVEDTWFKLNVSGIGISIAVVDDGLQHSHPDISPNYNAAGSYDINYRDADPTPDQRADDHGTAAAGVAAASANAVCGVGVAPRASLSGLRLISRPCTDADEAKALSYRYDINHVYSCSWGPNDDGMRLEGPGRVLAAAMEDSITRGRGGKGTVYVWAAGNGRESGDNCNYDGYANSRYTITVGAVGSDGKQAWYSESCAALLVVAPSSSSQEKITTTDLLGVWGLSSSDCTSAFGGTSAAAPLAAGVVALVLEKNPTLTWRDVQHVLVRSAKKVDATDSDWFRNGGGFWVNHKYGFGLINAYDAVLLADKWQTVPAAVNVTNPVVTVNQAIPDGTSEVTSYLSVAQNITIEHVEVIFSASHPRRGELAITVISPSGTRSVLSEYHRDWNADYSAWKFTSTRCWGEGSVGQWTLVVSDKKSGHAGSLSSWQLIVHGYEQPLQ